MTGALDPGINCSGVALFEGEYLKAAACIRNPLGRTHTDRPARMVAMSHACAEWFKANGPIDVLVYEWPQVYREARQRYRNKSGGVSKRDPNDLLPLAGINLAVALAVMAPVRAYAPRAWKGTGDGDECTRRVRERLTPEEFSRIYLPDNTCGNCVLRTPSGACLKPSSCLAHNAYDGVGIGLKYLSRFERRRVFPR